MYYNYYNTCMPVTIGIQSCKLVHVGLVVSRCYRLANYKWARDQLQLYKAHTLLAPYIYIIMQLGHTIMSLMTFTYTNEASCVHEQEAHGPTMVQAWPHSQIPSSCVWRWGLGIRLKAGSQSDTRSCVALIHEMHKCITKKVGDFLTTRRKNATQGT